MSDRIYTLMLVSLPMLWAGNLVGWAIASKLAGPPAGAEFLKISAIGTSILFLVQAILYFWAKQRLVRQLIFASMAGLSLIWFMLCLILPIFWMQAIVGVVKIGLVIFSSVSFLGNFWFGIYRFNESWSENDPDINQYFDARSNTLDWDEIIKSLRLSVSMFIPGVPAWLEPVLSVLMVLLMLLGLNLRNIFPIFSVFVWGIPCIVVSATIFQMLALNVAQARKVFQLESILDAAISSSKHPRARRKRKRK